jgi:hypothetical protein
MSGFPATPLSATQVDEILAAVRPMVRAVLTSAARVEPGQALTASLLPASPQIDASDVVNGALNLGLTLKEIVFNGTGALNVPSEGALGDDLVGTASIVAAQPFPPPLPVLNGVNTPNPAGTIGQLFGAVTLPDVRVRIDVTWRVRDSAGTELTEGTHFIATKGVASPDVSVIVPPLFRELRLDTLQNPIGQVFCLSADVVLRLADRSLPFTLGPLPFIALPIFVPTVVALFSEPNFGLTRDGAVAIIVPEHSPFASAEPLFKSLRQVESVLGSLRSLASVAAWLLGISELVSSIPDQPRLRLVAANAVPKLGNIKIKRRPWYAVLSSDPDFDDEVRSLFVFGLPGTEVEFFNDTNFKRKPESKQGMFSLMTHQEGWVAVRNLDTSNDARPVTFPPNPFDNSYVPQFENDETGDSSWVADMSSVRFRNTWLAVVQREVESPPVPPVLQCGPPPIIL